MSEAEKKSSNTNAKFIQEIRRGDKEIDEIKVEIEFCNMNPELKSKCIEKTRDAMKTTLENNFSYFKILAKKIKLSLEEGNEEIWNVVVGSDFGAWISFDKSNMLYFRMDEIYFMIFRFGYDTK
jgi:hypothetical protein